MKYKRIICAAICLLNSVVKADLAQDAETIFNWAEKSFPQYFPSSKVTQLLDAWRYRYYPETGIYAGVNTSDNNIYVLGGEFGPSPRNVASSQALLTMAGSSPGNETGSCVNIAPPAKGTRFFEEITSKGQVGIADGVTGKRETLVIDASNIRMEQSVISTDIRSPSEFITNFFDTVLTYDVKGDMAYLSSIETNLKNDLTLPERYRTDPIRAKATLNPSVIAMPVNKACKNQTWMSTPSEQTTITIKNGQETADVKNINSNHTYTIEAIDEVISTPAGSFKTIRLRNESDTDVLITWTSIDLGFYVKRTTAYKNSTRVMESILTDVQH